MPKKLGVGLGFPVGPDEYADLLTRLKIADEMGVDSAWVGEIWGREMFTYLGMLAGKTKNIKIGPGIVNNFSRSAAVLAMSMATLDEMTGGRTVFGIGTSGQLVIEGFHGVPFDRPVQRLKEYVEIFNAVVSGEKLNYEGEIFKLTRGFKLLFKPVRSHIPVYIASITPKSIIQTGAIADGWMPIFWPKERFQEGRALLAQGAEGAGRAGAHIEIAPTIGLNLIGPGDDAEAIRRKAREPIAFYVTRMGVFYYQMLERNGYEAEVAGIRKAFADKDDTAMIDAVSTAMMESLTVTGTLEECAEQLNERRALGVDLPIIDLPKGEPKHVERVLSAFLS